MTFKKKIFFVLFLFRALQRRLLILEDHQSTVVVWLVDIVKYSRRRIRSMLVAAEKNPSALDLPPHNT